MPADSSSHIARAPLSRDPRDLPSLPLWARVADLLSLVLIALAAIVAEWGGFRWRIGSSRLALTSPYRALAAAAVVIAVRHAIVRRPNIVQDVWGRCRALWRAPDIKIAWTVFAATRPVMLFIGYFAVVTLGYNNGRPQQRFTENEFQNLQAKWDTTWYVNIAVNGYSYDGDTPGQQQRIVFFPALPMAMRVAGRLFGGTAPAFLWGGTLVVFAAFLWSLVYVYRLARDWLGDDEQARWAVWTTAAYPFAVYFGAVYTESFFLLGAAGAFYHFRRRELVRAGAFGLLIGLTRPNGCFLSIPLALIAIWPWLPHWLAGGPGDAVEGSAARRSWSGLAASLVCAAMPGVGMLIFSAFVWSLTGNPLTWMQGQLAWGREYNGLIALLVKYYGYVAESGLYVVTRVLPFDTLNGIGALFVVAAAWPVWRRFGLPYAAFILINILTPLSAGGLLSTGRLSTVLFPAFVWFAAAVPARHRPGWIGSFMAVQALIATLFYTWHEMF